MTALVFPYSITRLLTQETRNYYVYKWRESRVFRVHVMCHALLASYTHNALGARLQDQGQDKNT